MSAVSPASPRRIPAKLRARRLARTQLGIPRIVTRTLMWDLAAGCCAGAFLGTMMPFLIKIARDTLGASPFLIAIMSASFFIGSCFAPIWARQMEGRGKLPFCIGAWTVARALLFLLLLPVGDDPRFFVGVIFGVQFITTAALPAYASLMRDIYPDRARGRLMGYVRVALQSFMFLATLITGRLLDAGVSHRTIFPVAGLIGIGAAYAFSHVRPHDKAATDAANRINSESAGTHVQFWRDMLKILRDNAPYRYFALSVTVYGFGNLVTQPLYGLFQVDELHITGTQIANLINFTSLCSIGGSFFWGRFLDRAGSPRTVFYSIVAVTLMPLVYIFSPRVETLFIAAGLWGIGFSGVELSYMASILGYAEEGRAAQYQSLHSLLQGIRGVLAPLVAIPLLHAIGYKSTFLIAFGIMIAGCLLQYIAVRLSDRAKQTAPVPM